MIRYSHQREVVLNILKDTKTHPTANWIYEKARQKLPNISLGTVYRNLIGLRNEGAIISFSTGDGSEHFDATVTEHYHFCCEKCAKIYDIEMQGIDLVNQTVENRLECTILRKQVLLYGYCKNCIEK